MSSKFTVSDDIKQFITEIIAKNDLKQISDVIYKPGSEIGDGYMTNTLAVDIIKEDGDKLKLFLKYDKNMKSNELFPTKKFYANEIYFYDVIYPEYRRFLKEIGAESFFRNIPKCYGTSTENYIIALENINEKGYTLFDRKKFMNDNHITLVLKTFAKFHAISYAFKDQKRTKYEELVNENIFNFFSSRVTKLFEHAIKNGLNNLTKSLDLIKHKHILERCSDLVDVLVASLSCSKKYLNKYSVLTQGDSWCNNMMFLYEEEDKENSVDVMLIDWQLIREASPVCDISYFFYTVASEEALDKLEDYLRIYHGELSKYIKIFGSDPETIYPFRIFNEEWKEHCKFGFAMAVIFIRIMLSSKEETTNLDDINLDNLEERQRKKKPIKLHDEYMRRLRVLADHFIKHNFL